MVGGRRAAVVEVSLRRIRRRGAGRGRWRSSSAGRSGSPCRRGARAGSSCAPRTCSRSRRCRRIPRRKSRCSRAGEQLNVCKHRCRHGYGTQPPRDGMAAHGAPVVLRNTLRRSDGRGKGFPLTRRDGGWTATHIELQEGSLRVDRGEGRVARASEPAAQRYQHGAKSRGCNKWTG